MPSARPGDEQMKAIVTTISTFYFVVEKQLGYLILQCQFYIRLKGPPSPLSFKIKEYAFRYAFKKVFFSSKG